MNEIEQAQLLRDVRLALQADDYSTAIRNLQQIIARARERGDVEAIGRHLGNLALIYYRQGDRAQALAHFEQALDCARQEQDRLTEEGLLGNMGNILREMGRYEEAHRSLAQALTIADEVEDTRGRGIWLGNMGLIYDDVRQPQRAAHGENIRMTAVDDGSWPELAGRSGGWCFVRRPHLDTLPYTNQTSHLLKTRRKSSALEKPNGVLVPRVACLKEPAPPRALTLPVA
ncbi:tetratricopeptide repeat protein, partial [bacterium]|nr:tetratricopeptide repeat protein [bacterium]